MPLIHMWSLAVEEQFYIFYHCFDDPSRHCFSVVAYSLYIAIFLSSFVISLAQAATLIFPITP